VLYSHNADNAKRKEQLFKYTPKIGNERKWGSQEEGRCADKEDRTKLQDARLRQSRLRLCGNHFGTRVTSGVPLDVLAMRFRAVQLVFTVVALIVGTTVVALMVRRKQINSQWSAA